MKNEKSERKFDFRPMGLAIKKAREKKGMTQEQLADIIGRDTRTVMYHENDGQHPSLDIFYQLATMFDLSVDEYFYPNMSADEAAKKRINIQLNSLSENELRLVEGICQRNHRKPWNGGSVRNGAASVFCGVSGGAR
jgi:DNA-binding XRE family transcriptional regulator